MDLNTIGESDRIPRHVPAIYHTFHNLLRKNSMHGCMHHSNRQHCLDLSLYYLGMAAVFEGLCTPRTHVRKTLTGF